MTTKKLEETIAETLRENGVHFDCESHAASEALREIATMAAMIAPLLSVPEPAESAEAFWPKWAEYQNISPDESWLLSRNHARMFAETYAASLRQQLQAAQQALHEACRDSREMEQLLRDRAEKSEAELKADAEEWDECHAVLTAAGIPDTIKSPMGEDCYNGLKERIELLVAELAALKLAGEGWIPCDSDVVKIKHAALLYVDLADREGSEADRKAAWDLIAALPPAPVQPAEGPAK